MFLTALRPSARRALRCTISTLPPSTSPLTVSSNVRAQFEEDGFVMMEGLLPMSTVEALLGRWGGDSQRRRHRRRRRRRRRRRHVLGPTPLLVHRYRYKTLPPQIPHTSPLHPLVPATTNSSRVTSPPGSTRTSGTGARGSLSPKPSER